MKSLRINIILPFITAKPNGGIKIMYEYANRLAARGNKVRVIHSIQRPYRKIKSPVLWKQIVYTLRKMHRPPWFGLHGDVESSVVPEIIDRYVPDGDIVISTWWEMAYMVSRLSLSKGKKFNLIQDYETWKGYEHLVHDSYKLPVQTIVIAKYLKKLVGSFSATEPILIPNSINLEKFNIINPPLSRDPHSVIMLYSNEPRKGSRIGIDALCIVQNEIRDLKVDLFGTFPKPPDLPDFITYHRKPSNLAELMNRNAIFLSPSNGEGWALPPAEAMACGCAVVCTKIGGHADYAFDNQTALLTEPGRSASMAEAIRELMLNDDLRLALAMEGHDFISREFSWGHSVELLETVFRESV